MKDIPRLLLSGFQLHNLAVERCLRQEPLRWLDQTLCLHVFLLLNWEPIQDGPERRRGLRSKEKENYNQSQEYAKLCIEIDTSVSSTERDSESRD
jgi:hypothetical protein